MDSATVEHLTEPETKKKQIKVLIAEPSSGSIDSWVYDNRKDFMVELARLEARSDFKFGTGNTARLHIEAAREETARHAIELGYDYLFMVDDDQLIPKNCFERLYQAMQKHGADIASPMVTQRVAPYNPVIWKAVDKKEFDDAGNLKSLFIDHVFMHDFEPNATVFPDAVGFGVVLIAVDLIKRMKAPWFYSNRAVGEDLWFCIRAKREYNAKIVCDTSIKAFHMGYPIARGEYDWIKQDKARFEKFKHLYPATIAHEQAQNDGLVAPGLE